MILNWKSCNIMIWRPLLPYTSEVCCGLCVIKTKFGEDIA
jgi:hypothetical protein